MSVSRWPWRAVFWWGLWPAGIGEVNKQADGLKGPGLDWVFSCAQLYMFVI